MARKKITADLNGGDALTAMGDLLFQVHDASDDSIIATANYAAIGSVNSNGTDAANITYTLNASGGAGGSGQIILDGVDIGSVTDIKIKCKDGDGNEAILSNNFSLSLEFTLNTMIEQSEGEYQNDSLSPWDGYGVTPVPISGDFEFKITVDNQNNNKGAMLGISTNGTGRKWSDATPWDFTVYNITSDFTVKQRAGSASLANCDVNTQLTFTNNDYLSLKRVGTVLYIYLNTSLIHTFSTPVSASDIYLFIAGAANTDGYGYVSQPRVT